MKVHQNIVIDGKDYGDKKERKDSKFCNEGKWNNFIKPLLPEDCSDMTLVEFGSNAGLFLKMAKEHGFRDVVGIESNKKNHQAAFAYLKSLPGDLRYTIINDTVREDFDYDSIPVSDVTILANFHYHVLFPDFLWFMDRLIHKTREVIVVSIDYDRRKHWLPKCKLEDVRRYFKDWKEVGLIDNISKVGDTHGRDMFSIKFKSDLTRTPFDKLNMGESSLDDLIELVLLNGPINKATIEKTTHYKYVKKNHKNWSDDQVYEFVKGKAELMRSVKSKGLSTPISTKNGEIIDGKHRAYMIKAMYYNSIITREV